MEEKKSKLGRKKKKSSSLSFGYIVNKVSEGSYLTKTQITDSVNLVNSFIAELLVQPICPEDIEIAMPYLGKLKFRKKAGLKAGSTYKKPIAFGTVKDENGKGKMETIVLEEDQPDYLSLRLSVSPTLKEGIKEMSKERWKKKNGKK